MRKAQAHAATRETLEQLHQNKLEQHAGELAYHFGEARAVSGTEKMVRYSLLAGEKALETFAYEQALVHFDRVLAAKAVPEVDAESAAAHFGLARAQVATLPRHEMGQAHLNLSRAFDYYVSVGDTGQFVAISVLPFPNLLEHRLPSRRLVTRALELVADDSLEAGRLYSFQGRVQGMQDGDYQSARLSFDRALAIARRASDTVLELRTLGSAAQVEMWHNHFEDSLKSGLMAIDLCLDASDLRGEVDARYWAALASRTLGDFEGLRVQCLAMLEPAERLRDRYWLATSHSIVAYLGFSSGEWQSAREATQRGLDLMPLDPRILMFRVFLDIQTGDQDQAEYHLERLEEVVRQSQPGPTTANACLALMSPLARSIFGVVKRPDLSESSINAVLSSPSVTPYFSIWATIGASLLAVMNDDSEAAREQYAALKPSAGINIYVNVDRILGLLARTSGDLGQAAGHFEDALSFCRKAGYNPELAWTCFDYTETLIARAAEGDRIKATSLLEESLAQSTELGMQPLIERATGLVETLGTPPTARPAYPDGLTQREIEVLRLVAAGKTDREIAESLIISVNTVGNHVRSILNKTTSANRTEAAAYAALRGLAGGAGESNNFG